MIGWIKSVPGVNYKLRKLGFHNSGLPWHYYGLQITPDLKLDTHFSDYMPSKKDRVWITIEDVDQLLLMVDLGIPVLDSLPELLKDKVK